MDISNLVDGENIIFGPPGCGKTTTLSKLVKQFVKIYGPDKILITSFTNAAAQEIAGRQLPIPDHAVNTLHGHAYRALGRPPLVAEHIDSWNEKYGTGSDFYITSEGGGSNVGDDVVAHHKSKGDKFYHDAQRYRARRIPVERWPDEELRQFHHAWEQWKLENDLMDFTDLIENALARVYAVPYGARVLIADECFTAGTLILTERGLVPIEHVTVGDKVLTHHGRWRPVTATMQREARTVVVRGHGHYGLTTTAEHPFLTQQGWIDAKSLKEHRWASPIKFPPSDGIPPIEPRRNSKRPWLSEKMPCIQNNSFLWLVGRYLADGSVSSSQGRHNPDAIDRTWWSVATHKLDACEYHLANIDANYRVNDLTSTDKAVNIVVGGGALARWMANECGRRAHNKALPQWVLGLPPSQRAAVWDGYVAGDGAVVNASDSQPITKITTVSRELALGMKLLAQSLGYTVRWYIWEKDDRTWYQIVAGVSKRYADTDDLHIYTGVREIRETETLEQVYNLSVADDESYVADGIVVHNCQDFTRLEMDLIQQWGSSCTHLILAGDDDQSLYFFKGAEPEDFIGPHLGDDHKHILEQSYRVPRAVQAVAEKWIKRVETRQPKVYRPREERGQYINSTLKWDDPRAVIDLAEEYEAEGRTVMLLATCGYMLKPMIKEMRDRGLPFWNPYSPRRGDWSPLAPRKGVSAGERIMSFLRPQAEYWGPDAEFWTGEELWNWVEPLAVKGVMKHGYKKKVQEAAGDSIVDIVSMGEWFEDDALEHIYGGDLDWYLDHLQTSKQPSYEYPMMVMRKRGPSALRQRPKIIIGTIHSVKGGEADVVVLFPDLSQQGWVEWCKGGRSRDAIVRQGYVGMTRARDTLILGKASGNRTMW